MMTVTEVLFEASVLLYWQAASKRSPHPGGEGKQTLLAETQWSVLAASALVWQLASVATDKGLNEAHSAPGTKHQ